MKSRTLYTISFNRFWLCSNLCIKITNLTELPNVNHWPYTWRCSCLNPSSICSIWNTVSLPYSFPPVCINWLAYSFTPVSLPRSPVQGGLTWTLPPLPHNTTPRIQPGFQTVGFLSTRETRTTLDMIRILVGN